MCALPCRDVLLPVRVSVCVHGWAYALVLAVCTCVVLGMRSFVHDWCDRALPGRACLAVLCQFCAMRGWRAVLRSCVCCLRRLYTAECSRVCGTVAFGAVRIWSCFGVRLPALIDFGVCSCFCCGCAHRGGYVHSGAAACNVEVDVDCVVCAALCSGLPCCVVRALLRTWVHCGVGAHYGWTLDGSAVRGLLLCVQHCAVRACTNVFRHCCGRALLGSQATLCYCPCCVW